MAGWLDGWMVGWLDGWMAGWLDGWMAGWDNLRGREFIVFNAKKFWPVLWNSDYSIGRSQLAFVFNAKKFWRSQLVCSYAIFYIKTICIQGKYSPLEQHPLAVIGYSSVLPRSAGITDNVKSLILHHQLMHPRTSRPDA